MTLKDLTNKFGSYTFLNDKRVKELEDFVSTLDDRVEELEKARKVQIGLNKKDIAHREEHSLIKDRPMFLRRHSGNEDEDYNIDKRSLLARLFNK